MIFSCVYIGKTLTNFLVKATGLIWKQFGTSPGLINSHSHQVSDSVTQGLRALLLSLADSTDPEE